MGLNWKKNVFPWRLVWEQGKWYMQITLASLACFQAGPEQRELTDFIKSIYFNENAMKQL